MHRRWLVLLSVAAIVGAGVLTACGDENDKVPSSVIITLQPEPVATIIPGCVPDELESWYEVASALIGTIRDESKVALTLEPDQAVTFVVRLSTLRDAVAEQPAPECVAMTHNLIMLHIRSILSAFQQYSNGALSQDDLRSQVNASIQQIDTSVTDLLNVTKGTLQQALLDQRATQQAATATPAN